MDKKSVTSAAKSATPSSSLSSSSTASSPADSSSSSSKPVKRKIASAPTTKKNNKAELEVKRVIKHVLENMEAKYRVKNEAMQILVNLFQTLLSGHQKVLRDFFSSSGLVAGGEERSSTLAVRDIFTAWKIQIASGNAQANNQMYEGAVKHANDCLARYTSAASKETQ